ncbi:MAG: glycosyltransferase [Actinomycetota bacterium]|nr:glycosyltransferase [Actinomycetota bacterium]
MAIAPLVVVVLVANDPGDWFEESVVSILASDYPNLSLMIVDNGSKVSLSPRVANVAPNALLVRNDKNVGFSAAVNDAIASIAAADFILPCHDDVEFAPDAVSVMVEDALRTNAGIVTPKIVSWRYPERVISLGIDVDRTAAIRSRIDVGDVDQDQYAIVDEVFAAPGAAMMIRFDLFRALDGLDSEIFLFGEDVEISLRAQLAGARIVASSYARVKHMGVLANGVDPEYVHSKYRPIRRRLRRAERSYYVRINQLRAINANFSGWPRRISKLQLAVIALLEASFFAVTGRLRTTRAILRALLDGLFSRNSQNNRWESGIQSRIMEFRDLKGKFSRGSSRVAAFFAHQRNVRAQLRYEVERSKRAEGMALLDKAALENEEQDPTSLATRYVQRRLARAIQLTVAIYLLVASRHLLFSSIPYFGQFNTFPHGSSLLSDFFAGNLSGVTSVPTSVPAGYLWIGAIGSLFFGGTALFYHLFIVGLVVLGLLGAYRLGAKFKNPLSSTIAMVAYFASGVLVSVVSSGSLFGLVTYAFAPFLVGISFDALEQLGKVEKLRPKELFRGALICALATSVAPDFIFVAGIFFLSLILIAFARHHSARSIGSLTYFLGAILFSALLLNLTWFLGYLSGGATIASLFGASPSSGLSGLNFLSFGVSSGSALNSFSPLLLLVVPLGLVTTRFIRFERAIAATIATFIFLIFGFASNGGALGSDPIPLTVFAPFVATFVAYSLANSVDSLYRDLPQQSFGIRQISGAVAILILVISSFGVGAPISAGRLGMPSTSYSNTLSFISETSFNSSNLLWIGSPSSLPAGSWWFDNNVAFAVTHGATLSYENIYTPISQGVYSNVAGGITRASLYETTRLGSYLAEAGIGNLIYPQSGFNSAVAKITLTLARQRDLVQVLTDPTVNGYSVTGRAVARAPQPSGALQLPSLILAIFETLLWLAIFDLVVARGFVVSRIVTRIRVSLMLQRDERIEDKVGGDDGFVGTQQERLKVRR